MGSEDGLMLPDASWVVAYARLEVRKYSFSGYDASKQQIPCGNDRKKSKCKSDCKSVGYGIHDFASKTQALGLTIQDADGRS
jgi:hypothetical protein